MGKMTRFGNQHQWIKGRLGEAQATNLSTPHITWISHSFSEKFALLLRPLKWKQLFEVGIKRMCIKLSQCGEQYTLILFSPFFLQMYSPTLRRLCERLGHFYLNVYFPEDTASVAERRREMERSSICVLLLKPSANRSVVIWYLNPLLTGQPWYDAELSLSFCKDLVWIFKSPEMLFYPQFVQL